MTISGLAMGFAGSLALSSLPNLGAGQQQDYFLAVLVPYFLAAMLAYGGLGTLILGISTLILVRISQEPPSTSSVNETGLIEEAKIVLKKRTR
jgi:hypothetical protein